MEPYIDAHSHVWTPDLERYPLAPGFLPADVQPRSFTAEELLAHARPAGVGRVNLIQMSFYGFNNAYLLDMIKAYPDRFVGTALVNPFAPDPGRVMRALKPLGVKAFRIQSVAPYSRSGAGGPAAQKPDPAHWLEPDGYAAMFAAAAETGQALSCLIDPDAFPEVDRACSRYPGTTVVIDHLGRVGASGAVRDADVQALCALARHPKLYVKVGAFYALGQKTPPYLDLAPLIRAVVRAFGPERCMWESDCPFQVVDHTYKDSLDLVRGRLVFLSPADREWLLRKTAEKIYFAKK